MRRIFVALAVLAVAAVVITGCGGGGGGNGGGGGGGGDTTSKATLSGRVLDPSGLPVSGASVAVDTGAGKALLSATTNSSGQYSIPNVPLGVLFNLSASYGGNTTQMNGLNIGTDAGSSASMNLVVGGDPIPAGSTVEIDPTPLPVYAGETTVARIRVHDQYGDELSPSGSNGWKASMVVTGSATAQLSDEYNSFGVKGGTAGQTARITVLVVTSNGYLASASQTVTVRSMDAPPPPPM